MTNLNFSKSLQKVTITVLVENTAGRRGLLGEHGLAFWIEADGKPILEDTGETFWRDPAHQELDQLPDDQALFMTCPEGWVVVLGCAHSGVINTLDYIAQLTGTRQFYLVMGGMHLLFAPPERLRATVTALTKYNVQKIGANHYRVKIKNNIAKM